MEIYSYAVFTFGVCSFFAGILVLSKRNDFLGHLFGIYSFALASWGIGASAMLNNNAPYSFALWAIRYADGTAFFIPVLWVHLVSLLTNTYTTTWKITIRFLYSICIILFPFAFTPWFIPKIAPIMDYAHFTTTGPIFWPLTVLYFTLVPCGFFKLLLYLFKKDKNPLNRPAILGFGFFSLIGYSVGAVCFPPAYGIPTSQEVLLLMPIYPLGLGYCMMRHGLFTEEALAEAAHKDKLAAMGTLTASINHEIRSPLFVMRGMLDRQAEINGPSTDNQTMQNQMARIESIIKRFSQFAKLETANEPKLEILSLKEILESTLEIAHYEINYHLVKIEKIIPPDLPSIRAEKQSLEQVLFNLIINACQALKDQPEKNILFTAEGMANHVLLKIQDNGSGISKESIQKIFKPFFTTKGEGTGLGLYITRRLILSMNGKIDVRSSPAGTCFTLSFPTAS